MNTMMLITAVSVIILQLLVVLMVATIVVEMNAMVVMAGTCPTFSRTFDT